jgi:hypothetical protein
VLTVCKVDIILIRDKFGSTPLDYNICLNHAAEATTAIRTIFAKSLGWLGLVRWKSDMTAAMDEALACCCRVVIQ